MSEQIIVAITAPISRAKIEQIEHAADKVYFYPDGDVPPEISRQVNIWYTTWTGFPSSITDPGQVPKTKMIQLSSAGANKVLCSQVMTDAAKKRIQVCSASGIHALSIPQWIIANIVNLYMRLHHDMYIARQRQVWPSQALVKDAAGALGAQYPSNRTIFGKTVGMLGYGHIAREAARLLKAFNCEIIAANSKGDKRVESGYTIPGTGDLDGNIPSQYYATTDPDSFSAFLSRCDILVCSLPSTPQTTSMLDADHLSKLPEGAILLNVGRGDLIRSDVLLEALDAPGGLSAVALDVTDPEPLPDHHPLYTHSAAIITGHTSGSFEGYYDAGADILIAQLKRLKDGEPFMNVVDPDKGY